MNKTKIEILRRFSEQETNIMELYQMQALVDVVLEIDERIDLLINSIYCLRMNSNKASCRDETTEQNACLG